jgi:predicted dehydrogenase
VLVPAFRNAGATLQTIVSAGGVSSMHHGARHGFRQASTDPSAVLDDPDTQIVVVATRHDTHADYVCRALDRGKHVFVEKPLAVTRAQVEQVERCVAGHAPLDAPLLMVGFNRRFSPLAVKARALLAGLHEPRAFVMTVNAGAMPAQHWTQDTQVGGGRLVGEACHFVDLLRHLARGPVVRTRVSAIRNGSGPVDRASISLDFADGSIGTIHYLSNGHASFPKERLEVFCGGRVLQLDNFRTLRGFGWPGFSRLALWRQDKGQSACAKAFVDAVAGGSPSPIALEEVLEVANVTLAIFESIDP